MLAAEAAFEALGKDRQRDALEAYPAAFEASWLHAELHKTRNFKPYMKRGPVSGHAAVRHRPGGCSRARCRGRCTTAPTTTSSSLRPSAPRSPTPKPDGVLTFDRLSSGVSVEHQPRGRAALPPEAEGRLGADQPQTWRSTTPPSSATARQGCTRSSRPRPARACKSMRRTACTARPATSRTRPRTSIGVVPQGGEGPIYQGM